MARIISAIIIAILLLQFGCKKDETPVAPQNHAPVIEQVIASPNSYGSRRIAAGTQVALYVFARDPDKDNLSYRWSAEKGSFISRIDTASAKWQAPQSASDEDCVISITVSDGVAATTSSITVYVGKVPPPQPPTLLSPTNNDSDQSVSPTLRWKASNGAIRYALHVSASDSLGSSVYNDTALTDTSRQIAGLANSTQYYWRVRATNNYGTSNWSTVWSFTTRGLPPSVPELLSLSNNALEQSTSPILTWNVSSGATSYALQVSQQSNFSDLIFDDSELTSTYQQITGLANNTQYFWRVRASNKYGSSDWSTSWSLTTIGTAPTAPVLNVPMNNAIDQSTSPMLSWGASSGATNYALQVSTNSSFTSFVYDDSTLTDTSLQLTGLANNQIYYWQVRAMNKYGTSSWSTAWNFTTVAAISIQGFTVYAGTTIPVSGVIVQVQGKSTTTGLTGFYRVDDLFPGATMLTATKSGHDDYSTSVTLVAGTNSKDIEMTSGLYTHNLSGSVSSATTGQPLPSVSVTVLNDDGTTSQLTATSDNSGRYQVSAIPDGQRRIRFSKRNYQSRNEQIFISNTDNNLNIQLRDKPGIPTNPFPSDGSIMIASCSSLNLKWDCTDPDGDPIRYDVYFGTSNPPSTLISSNRSVDSLLRRGITENTTYFWRVVANSEHGDLTYGPIWSFTIDRVDLLSYGEKYYQTVLIGSQCWLKENLNVGTMIPGTADQTNNGMIEKYCYNNDTTNCTDYGGLYQWDEAMQYSTTPGSQGICPSGWHIPTLPEFQALSEIVEDDGNALKAIGQGSGSGAGTNTSGFSALLAGYRNNMGSFLSIGEWGDFWFSNQGGNTTANHLLLYNTTRTISILPASKDLGYSIRCIKD